MKRPAIDFGVSDRPRNLAPPTRQRAEAAEYRIENSANGPTEIWLYEEIGYWGVSASVFAKDLAEVKATEITVRLNSPGGDVFDGIAILNSLRCHPADVTVMVDGLAASAASFIAMAGDRVIMGRNAEMMIHDAMGLCIGNAADMTETAEMLERVSDNIASVYHDRAGGGVKSWRTAMRAETWYSASEAVEAGLADEVAKPPAKEEGEEDGRLAARWDYAVFNYAGRTHAPAPVLNVVDVPGGEDVLPEVSFNFRDTFRTAMIAAVEPEPIPFNPDVFRAAVQVAANDAPAPPAPKPVFSPEPVSEFAIDQRAFIQALREARL